MGYFFLF